MSRRNPASPGLEKPRFDQFLCGQTAVNEVRWPSRETRLAGLLVLASRPPPCAHSTPRAAPRVRNPLRSRVREGTERTCAMASTRAVLQVFEKYQKDRVTFVQTVAELATRPQNIEPMQSAGVMALLRPLLLDNVPRCARHPTKPSSFFPATSSRAPCRRSRVALARNRRASTVPKWLAHLFPPLPARALAIAASSSRPRSRSGAWPTTAITSPRLS